MLTSLSLNYNNIHGKYKKRSHFTFIASINLKVMDHTEYLYGASNNEFTSSHNLSYQL